MGKDDGEPSQKKEHINGHCDNDRPLKKARYVWQVKGKYHLKEACGKAANGSNSSDKIETEERSDKSDDENVQDENHDTLNTMANVPESPKTNNNNAYSDLCCIESFIARSENIMESSNESDSDSPPKNIDQSISDEIPVTLVKPNDKNHDFYLRKWQARQVAKGFVDNTINRVLENFLMPFDATDLVENCDNGEQVEDEGILMAIQSHGLQSGAPQTSSCQSHDNENSVWPPEQQCTCSHSHESPTEQNQNNLLPFHKRRLCRIPIVDVENEENFWVCEMRNTVAAHYSDAETESRVESSEDNEEPNGEQINEHMNFMDAAVAAAIQKKGLTSNGGGFVQ